MDSLARSAPPASVLLDSARLGALSVDPVPIIQRGKRTWTTWAGALISVAVLIAALSQWRQLDLATIAALLPTSLAFWLVYFGYYFVGPASEWVIFRRLWNLPPSGILPLLRKKVSNELVLGYIGEVYFYLWARRHTSLTAAPFGAIKDVTILSAMAGNAVTLAMLLAGAPLFGSLFSDVKLDLSQQALLGSVAFVIASSMLVLLLRRRVLSLPRREQAFVMVVHVARVFINIGLLGLMWHLALPQVPLLWWVLLSLLRQLVSRLPFVPNKDVVFASLAIFLIGEDGQIAALMALVAGVILITHLIIGAVLGVLDLAASSQTAASQNSMDQNSRN